MPPPSDKGAVLSNVRRLKRDPALPPPPPGLPVNAAGARIWQDTDANAADRELYERVQLLQREMALAAREERYAEAAVLRDRHSALQARSREGGGHGQIVGSFFGVCRPRRAPLGPFSR